MAGAQLECVVEQNFFARKQRGKGQDLTIPFKDMPQ